MFDFLDFEIWMENKIDKTQKVLGIALDRTCTACCVETGCMDGSSGEGKWGIGKQNIHIYTLIDFCNSKQSVCCRAVIV